MQFTEPEKMAIVRNRILEKLVFELMKRQLKMIIKVEFKSDVLGNDVFWKGPGANIMNIKNLVARKLAEGVVVDGVTRSAGMWIVSEVKEKD